MASTEEEFAQFWANLSPSEQQQFQYTFGMTPQDQAGQLTGGFPVQPEFDFGQDLGSIFDANVPQLTTKGAVDPLDLSQLMSRLNYTQDVGGSMFDLAQTLFAGPDAWGDPSAFEPITTYTGKAVPAIMGDDGQPRPATASARMLDDYTANGGYEAFIADAVRSGMTASQAVAQMRQLVESGANATDPKLREQALQIRNTLPMRITDTVDQFNQPIPQADRKTATWNNFDEKGMLDFATGLYKDKVDDEMSSATLQFDPKTGQYYESVETEDSPTALKFRNAGLPTPFERFDDPEYIEKAMQSVTPGYQNDVAAFQQDVGQQGSDWKTLADEYAKASRNQGDLTKAWEGSQPRPIDPLLGGLGNRGAGVPSRPPSPAGLMAPAPAAAPAPSAGHFVATNAPKYAGSTSIPAQGALGQAGTPTPQQQAAQMESLLASQFRINPAQTTPGGVLPRLLGPSGDSVAQPSWDFAGPDTPGPRVRYDDSGNATMMGIGDEFRMGALKPGKIGTLNRGDVKNATNRTNATRKKATDAYNAMTQQESRGAPGDYERAYTAAMLRGQARSGQTPLQVAMLARLASLGQRAGLGG